MVFLHHTIASWPSWPEYAELIGGRFHFLPGELDGRSYPGSGYRFNVRQTVTVESPGPPIVDGIAPVFDLRDEAYLMPVLGDRVRPLLRSNYDFVAENFHHGGVDFKTHPRGSNLVGWTKMARNTPIAYLAHGHGP
ncbi:hypothetical protein [Dinoroseobacter sp. S76]|uniref:hypothetical protein n=1 Tax=Dinoroseobacter sp. S76 TaxID=3415124 RepID=UPI003C798F2B